MPLYKAFGVLKYPTLLLHSVGHTHAEISWYLTTIKWRLNKSVRLKWIFNYNYWVWSRKEKNIGRTSLIFNLKDTVWLTLEKGRWWWNPQCFIFKYRNKKKEQIKIQNKVGEKRYSNGKMLIFPNIFKTESSLVKVIKVEFAEHSNICDLIFLRYSKPPIFSLTCKTLFIPL